MGTFDEPYVRASKFQDAVDSRPVERFRNWCRPKSPRLTWFSARENHSSRFLLDHSNCETALSSQGWGWNAPESSSVLPRGIAIRKDLRLPHRSTQGPSPHPGDEKRHLFSNCSQWKRRPLLCHPERSRGICSFADPSWKCFSNRVPSPLSSRPKRCSASPAPDVHLVVVHRHDARAFAVQLEVWHQVPGGPP